MSYNLLEINNLTKKNGIDFYLFSIGFKNEMKKYFTFNKKTKLEINLEKLANENNFKYVDLTSLIKKNYNKDINNLFLSCNNHFNKFGNEILTNLILNEGIKTFDPLWNLPLWSPYKSLLKSDIADLANISPGSYGGAITAALFLQHFVKPTTNWAHIDLFAWNLSSTPSRSRGGEVMAARAVFNAIKKIINED